MKQLRFQMFINDLMCFFNIRCKLYKMANITLCLSSVILGFLHIIGYSYLQTNDIYFACSLAIGITTSIWNHSCNSTIAKICDRIAITLCAYIDMYYIYYLPCQQARFICKWLICISIALYFLSRLIKSSTIHVCAHISISVTHLILLSCL